MEENKTQIYSSKEQNIQRNGTKSTSIVSLFTYNLFGVFVAAFGRSLVTSGVDGFFVVAPLYGLFVFCPSPNVSLSHELDAIDRTNCNA